jgi:hypothetical protein
MSAKAIIVAGGGPYEGNCLWGAVQRLTEQAYRTLYYRGFAKSDIRLLAFGTSEDFDKNGMNDEKYADPSKARIQEAITSWAAGATDVVLYLCTHGSNDSLLINGMVSPPQSLSASSLDSWLDALQSRITGKLIVVIDSCYSGSFIDNLAAPAGAPDRIVVCGTGDSQCGYFVNHGSVSFSGYFWPRILKGDSVRTAFSRAKAAIACATSNQSPVLNDNGNAIGNEPGDGTLSASTYIGGGAIQQLRAPNQRVIILAGAPAPNPSGIDPSASAIKNVASLAYHVLRSRGYSAANIMVLGPSGLPGYDAPATLNSLQNGIQSWIPGGANGLVYLIGFGAAGSFKLNATENLAPSVLAGYLNTLQSSYPGKVAVVLDSPFSGSFLPALAPPAGKPRIVIASSDSLNKAGFACDGDISFSQQFWTEVLDGDNLREAFLTAKTSSRYFNPSQIAILDDDGNGVGNERTDGELARTFVL